MHSDIRELTASELDDISGGEFTIVAELVRAGQGLAFLPRWTQPRPDGVVLRPLADLSVSRDLDALIRPENVARPAVSHVVAGLKTIAAALTRQPAATRG